MKKNNKKRVIIIIFIALALFIGISSYIYFARADDAGRDKYTIVDATFQVTSDGSEPFDQEAGAGNDTSANNNVIRTFDSVSYTINYYLQLKEPDANNLNTDERPVVVDVVVPKTVRFDNGNPESSVSSPVNVFDDYVFVEYETTARPDGNIASSSFTLHNIYGSNELEFTPVVLIKEKTDTTKKAISEMSDTEKASTLAAVLVSNSVIEATCEQSSDCNETISSKTGSTFVKLFLGNQSRVSITTKTTPLGFMAYIPTPSEGKGMKGIAYPESTEFDITFTNSNNFSTADLIYNSDINNYSSDMVIPNLIEAKYGDNYNGSVSATYNDETKKIHVTISDINPMTKDDKITDESNDFNYFTTGAFTINSVRKSETNKNDIVINASTGSNNIDIHDIYNKFVGAYESNIDIIADNAIEREPFGEAVLNYGESFTIENSFTYAKTLGDELDSLTNYTKIDNDAILLKYYGTDNKDYEITYSNGLEEYNDASFAPNATVQFGYGSWSTEFFDISPECNITNPTKEEIMNLYGGPCVTEKENKVIWTDHIGTGVSDELKEAGAIIVKTTYNKVEGRDGIYPYTTEKLTLSGIVKPNINLYKNVYQITTSATGKIRNENNEVKNVYLNSNYNEPNNDSIYRNKNNFVKTTYDAGTGSVGTLNYNTCNNNACPINGNSIIVSAFKQRPISLKAYYGDEERINFSTSPIKFVVSGGGIKANSEIDFESAMLIVAIDNNLEVKNIPGVREPDSVSTQDGVTIYTYNLTAADIDSELGFYQLKDIVIYADIKFDAQNASQLTNSAQLSYTFSGTNGNTLVTLNNIGRIASVDSEITIYNNDIVKMLGSVNTELMEKGASYEYTMKTYNNSKSLVEEGYNYNNAALYYILPHKKDSAYESMTSNFKSTSYKVKVKNMPEGYELYYTDGQPTEIIVSEMNSTSNKVKWTKVTDYSKAISDLTAIKITKSEFASNTYFGPEGGITVEVTPVGSSEGDLYYNSYYMIVDKPDNSNCDDDDCESQKVVYSSSSRPLVSIYNRSISGIVFEDLNYNGFYDESEYTMGNIPVSVCKVSKTIDPTKEYNVATDYVSTDDKCTSETVTSENGSFYIPGLSKGYYYVKYTYDNDKYAVTDISKIVTSEDSVSIQHRSNAYALKDTNIAVSTLTYIGDDVRNIKDVNLGLKIQKKFAVKLDKFISKVTVTSNGEKKEYTYDKSKKTTVNVKNPKNAHITVKYDFVIENIKYYPGTVGLIIDAIPKGMTFSRDHEENKYWRIGENNTLIYDGLSRIQLIPNEKNYFSLVLDLDVKEGGTYKNVISAKNLEIVDDIEEAIQSNQTEEAK